MRDWGQAPIPNNPYGVQPLGTDYESGGREFESLRARHSKAQRQVGGALFPRWDRYVIVVVYAAAVGLFYRRDAGHQCERWRLACLGGGFLFFRD
jgi:hypothetical protein